MRTGHRAIAEGGEVVTGGRSVRSMMQAVKAAGAPAPMGGYVAGMAVDGRLLFISGQTPEGSDGPVATEPEAQLRQVWALRAVVDGASARLQDLVQMRTTWPTVLIERSTAESGATFSATTSQP